MGAEKLSISHSPDAIRSIDADRGAQAIKSRSQVVEQAPRRLRDKELDSAYRNRTDPLSLALPRHGGEGDG